MSARPAPASAERAEGDTSAEDPKKLSGRGEDACRVRFTRRGATKTIWAASESDDVCCGRGTVANASGEADNAAKPK
jgi:hypothetical protein